MTIAVVIPVHNRPTLVVEAIKSIQTQSSAADEIIVVDDASTDHTRQVVEELSVVDPRIKLVRQFPNAGASAARNLGVAVARADWIAFLDSDDTWRGDKLELQLQALQANPDAIACFTGVRYLLAEGPKDYTPPAHVDEAALRLINHLGSTSMALIRKDALIKAGGFDAQLPSCQDWDLWLRLSRVGSFAIIPDATLFYSQADPVRISKNVGSVLDGHAIMFARALDGVTDAAERTQIKAYHKLRWAQIMSWDFDRPFDGAKAALQSIWLRPTRGAAGLLGWSLRKIIANTLTRRAS